MVHLQQQGQYNGPLFTNADGDLTISTTTTGTGNHNIDINTVGTGQVLVNTDVVIENNHELRLLETTTNGSAYIAHKSLADLSGTTTTYIWPTAPASSTAGYLTSDASGNLSWTNVTGILTTISEGPGITITNPATPDSSTQVGVDLKPNQGLRTISASDLTDSTADASELGLIAGTSPQDTLLWTVTGGANAINGGASARTTSPEGNYVNVKTTGGNGSGCTVNLTVDPHNTDPTPTGAISKIEVSNPGSGYTEADTLTIDGFVRAGGRAITFTLESDANSGRYTYTGWRPGALTTGSGGGGGDVETIEGGDGIRIDETDSTTPEVNVDLSSLPGLEFSSGQLQVKDANGIEVVNGGVQAVGDKGITVGTAGISVDLGTNPGLEIDANDKLTAKVTNGLELTDNGISTKIHPGGGLSDSLATGSSNGELGVQDPGTPGTSNQVLIWKAKGAAATVAVAGAPNNISDQSEADYINVATTDDASVGSDLTVNFTVGTGGTITALSIANPGQGYTAGASVVSVTGHGLLKLTVETTYADAQWTVEPFSGGGGGGGGGDVTGVDAGDGIDVSTGGGPQPVVSVDTHSRGALTNRFDTSATANTGELGIIPGNDNNDSVAWRENGAAATISNSGNSDQSAGSYVAVATTSAGGGSGLLVNFVLDGSGVLSSLSIADAGSGYSASNTATIDGHSGPTITIDTIYDGAQWAVVPGTTATSGSSGVVQINAGDGIDVANGTGVSPTISVDLKSNGGLAIESTELAVNLGHSSISGTLGLADGGTGLDASAVANGQLLIGNADSSPNSFTLATLTAGTGISIGNNTGSITIATTGAGNNTGNVGFWNRSNTPNVLSPVNAGDNISTTGQITSGTLNLNEDAVIIFEGATNSANETTLTVTDPTGDRTITLPDASGNVTLDPGHNGVANSEINYVRQVTTNAAGDGVASVVWVEDAGGDLTGIDAGDGITVSDGTTSTPKVSIDLHTDGGLTDNFTGVAATDAGEVGLTPGSNAGDIMVWRAAGAVVALDTIAGTPPANGTYTNIPTTGGNGSGLTVEFTIAGSALPDPITVINPGSGYQDDDAITITIAGNNITCAVNGVTTSARWQPGTPTSAVDDNGSAGHWTRDDGTDTLSPVVDNDSIDIGTGDFTGNTLNASTLQNGNDLIIQTTDNSGNIDINTHDTGVVQVNTDVVIEAKHALELVTDDSTNSVSHRAAASLAGNVTYDWPVAPTTAGSVLSSDTSGALTWTDTVTDLLPSGDLTGTAERRVLVWKGSGSVTAIGAASGNSAITIAGNYDAPTTVSPSGGTGLRVAFTLDGSGVVSNFRIASPGEGYSTSDTITVTAGHNFTTTVSTVTNSAQWNATQNQELAEGPGTENIFLYNGKTISSDYSIRQGLNAMSAGPITINNGVTVTIGDGESWAIV